MTPLEFIKKWAANERTERAASQSHFNDLCELLGHPKPLDLDKDGSEFTFDKGAAKLTGGEGFADVWKRHCFAWEYKGKHSDLTAAYRQVKRYAEALENPPLLIVSDMRTIIVHTAFTNAVKHTHEIRLEELTDPRKRELLLWAFTEPERLRPGRTRRMVTEEAANKFTQLAHSLHQRGHDPQTVAHFLDRIVFCMFAEDVGLLPGNIFTQIIHGCVQRPEGFVPRISQLFEAMVHGGDLVIVNIPWFNGGLFNDATALLLEPSEIRILSESADLDWGSIDPTIFGTLFERGLDPEKRSQLGAQYTDPETIMRIVIPVVTEPLTREWEAAKREIEGVLPKRGGQVKARKILSEFLDRLSKFRVLDPACGSGNFLYLALRELKNLEKRAAIEAEALGLHQEMLIGVGPEAVKGIEINPYAAELARVAVWIGELQWRVENGYQRPPDPILKPLDQIECRDAILNSDGTEPKWPTADVIVGNPPFLGDKKMVRAMGQEYVSALRGLYAERVPGGADLCCYWFEKLRAELVSGRSVRGGLVATDNIRSSPKNRKVLEAIMHDLTIIEAWTDQEWINEGAAVRVSLINVAREASPVIRLNGVSVGGIQADLSVHVPGGGSHTVSELNENSGIAFSGITKKGAFDIPGEVARRMLHAVAGPHGRKNAEVLFPWKNGESITKRDRDMWIISFSEMTEAEASLFVDPFEHVRLHVLPVRSHSSSAMERRLWWLLARRAPDLFAAIHGLRRFLVTPEVSKHRVFTWLSGKVIPDKNLVAIAREDDVSFGILQSRLHARWALRVGTRLENRPRYTSTTTFRTFPFPAGMAPTLPADGYADDPRAKAVAAAAKWLNELRENWLNPSELVDRVPEVVQGYPERLVPKSAVAAQELKKRTLTKLYNSNPDWLQHAHRDLDKAVAAAYGWEWPLLDEEILSRLFKLNQERASVGR